MERPLTEWEQRLVVALSNVDDPNAERVRESIPHLVVTGGCECGCLSFNVRDVRYPPQPHELEHYSTGGTPDGSLGVDLWLGPDQRPLSVNVEVSAVDSSADRKLPDLSALRMHRANA